jgi:hypothetical protein
MVQESDTGVDLLLAGTIKIEKYLYLGLFGLAFDLGFSLHLQISFHY